MKYRLSITGNMARTKGRRLPGGLRNPSSEFLVATWGWGHCRAVSRSSWKAVWRPRKPSVVLGLPGAARLVAGITGELRLVEMEGEVAGDVRRPAPSPRPYRNQRRRIDRATTMLFQWNEKGMGPRSLRYRVLSRCLLQ